MSIEMQSIKRTAARARYQRLNSRVWMAWGLPITPSDNFQAISKLPLRKGADGKKSVSQHNVEVVNYSPTNATRGVQFPGSRELPHSMTRKKNDSFAAVWIQICAPPWSNSHHRPRLSTNDFSGDHALLCFKLRESFVAG